MNSVRCQKCGLVLSANWTLCKRCGASQPIGDAEAPSSSDRLDRRVEGRVNASQLGSYDRSATQDEHVALSRLSFIIMGIGVLFLATGRYLGELTYPLALVLFLIGVGTSAIALIRLKRSGNADARLWPQVTSLVANSVLLITFAVVVPGVALASLVLAVRVKLAGI